MGKQITYESRPTGPRAAKVAWTYFESTYGKPPRQLRFDVMARQWVGTYEKNEERRMPAEEPA